VLRAGVFASAECHVLVMAAAVLPLWDWLLWNVCESWWDDLKWPARVLT
jgi:hypothetical protein